MRLPYLFFIIGLWLAFLPEAAHSSAGSARLLHPVGDTTRPALSYSLTVDSFMIGCDTFMQRYGRDDSSRALIAYYFRRRGNFRSFKDPADPMGSIAAILFFGTLFLPLLIYFGIRFSRRKLWQELNAYENGQPLPRWVVRKKSYRRIFGEITFSSSVAKGSS